MTTEQRTPCASGCRDARRHKDECEDAACRGCAPRSASHGVLCDSCHEDLLLVLHDAPRQVSELRAAAAPSSQWSLTAQPASGKVGPRLSSSAPDYIAAARSSMTAAQVETVRLACLDMAQHLEDALSELVEALATDYGLSTPSQLTTASGDRRERKWHPVGSDGSQTYRFEPVVTRRDELGQVESGQYVWTDPPAAFEVGTACRWLRAELTRLEHQGDIADVLEHLSGLMTQGHSLAPWREPSEPMRGVPCPQCHRVALRFFPGTGQARCQAEHCRRVWTWAQVAIWTRVLEDDREAGRKPGASWTSERGA